MTVASIICRAASHSPLPASASRITSQTPLSAHRRNCRKIEFQLPNSSGRSRHGAPVRINQNTASSTRRWLCGGRPPRRIRKGSKYAHSSSVINPRIKAALPQRAALNQFTIPASTDLSTRPSLHQHVAASNNFFGSPLHVDRLLTEQRLSGTLLSQVFPRKIA